MPSAGTIYKLPFAGKTLRKWRSVLVGALSLGLLACGCKGPKPAQGTRAEPDALIETRAADKTTFILKRCDIQLTATGLGAGGAPGAMAATGSGARK